MSTDSPSDDNAVPLYLVPVDFSPAARTALLHAAALAAENGGRLLALHVLHEPPDRPGLYHRARGRRSGLAPLEAGADALLQAFVASLRRERPELTALGRVETRLVDGLPAERILALADKLAVTAIILGRCRRSGLSRWIRGSVGDRVRHRSRCPVMQVYPEPVATRVQPVPASPVSPGPGA
jgi:nucleotide-binding universal stress UspA family protein